MNGRYNKNPIINAVRSSLIINAGMTVIRERSSKLSISSDEMSLIVINNLRSFSLVCFNINVFKGSEAFSNAFFCVRLPAIYG